MIDSNLPKVEKKAYTKPKMTEVRLVPQEAVLDVCKDGNLLNTLCLNVCANITGS
jgi:hypothetical protein